MNATASSTPAHVERLRKDLASGHQSMEKVRQALNVSTAELADLIRVPTRTLARRKESQRLEPDESDRLVRLARIVGLALRLFEGDLAQARHWLLASNLALGGEAPVRMATTEVGAREVEHLMGRLEHGIPL